MRSFTRKNIFTLMLLTAMLVVSEIGMVKGQVRYERIYASSQTSGNTLIAGTISDDALAIDKNLQTSSKISCSGLLTITQNKWQQLSFGTAFNRTIPIHIKLTTQVPLNLLGAITVKFQPCSGNTLLGSPITMSAGILGLIGGVNMLDFIVPAPGGGGTYDGVRVTLEVGGVAGTATINIYEAYYDATPSSAIICDQKIDYLFGVTGASLLSNVNDVTTPQYAIDGDYTTSALLRSNLTVAASVFETAVYSSLSKPGDSIRIVFQKQTGGLLNLSLAASSFKVTAISGNTAVTTLADQSSLLDLKLLAGSSTIQTLTFPVPSNSFDRVQVSLSDGLASALNGLYLYEIERIAPKPLFNGTGLSGGKLNTCQGTGTTINISNSETGGTYRWFDAAIGGNQLSSDLNADGTTFNTSNLVAGTYHYYVELVRSGCTDAASDRAKITIIVNSLPTITLGTLPNACQEAQNTTIPYTSTTGTPITYSITWDTNALTKGFTNVLSGTFPNTSPITITKPTNTNLTPGLYNGTINVSNANCTSQSYPFSFTVLPRPATPHLILTATPQL